MGAGDAQMVEVQTREDHILLGLLPGSQCEVSLQANLIDHFSFLTVHTGTIRLRRAAHQERQSVSPAAALLLLCSLVRLDTCVRSSGTSATRPKRK